MDFNYIAIVFGVVLFAFFMTYAYIKFITWYTEKSFKTAIRRNIPVAAEVVTVYPACVVMETQQL